MRSGNCESKVDKYLEHHDPISRLVSIDVMTLSNTYSHSTMTDPVLPSIQYVDASFPANPKPAPLPYPDPTKSFWLHSSPDCNPLADVGAETPLPDAVDVAIIGSGHSGICVLYHLVAQLRTSNRNVTRIAVFEARQFCSGATGRNGGKCISPCLYAGK